MSLRLSWPDYLVERDENRCIQCEVCAKQCANEVHVLDADLGKMTADESKSIAIGASLFARRAHLKYA